MFIEYEYVQHTCDLEKYLLQGSVPYEIHVDHTNVEGCSQVDGILYTKQYYDHLI